MRRVLEIALVMCAAVAVLGAGKKVFDPLTMVQLHRLNALAASRTRQMVVFGESQWRNETNVKTSAVYAVDYSATPATQTQVGVDGSKGTDMSPAVLDDGSVMFLSARSGSVQVHVAPADDLAHAYQVTQFPVDVDTFKAGSGVLAFTAMVYPGTTLAETARMDRERAARADSTQEWKKGFVRRWDAWWDGKYSHVHVVPLSKGADGRWGVDAAQVVDVMGGLDGDCPSRPFGGDDEYSVAADGQTVAFTTQVGRDMPWSTDLNVYLYDRATDSRECVTCANPATDTSPAFHPDGRHLVYLAMKEPGYESDTLSVMVYDLLTKETVPLNAANDISWGPVVFSPDGTRMYSSTLDVHGSQFFELHADGETPLLAAQDGTFAALAFAPCADAPAQQCAVVLHHTFAEPAEVFIASRDGTTMTALTHQNERALANVEFTEATLHTYTGANNDTVYGWLHKPRGFEAGKKYPLVMYIHGGPEDCWSNEFHYRWNPQLIAARGYAVFEPNLHGSHCASQGSAFTRSIRGNWGGWPYEDVLKALDYLRGIDWVDVDNAGAMGASYGGFMMNWLNSQTDAFKCIICHDGLFDTTSMYYETDELYFMANEFRGTPTDPDSLFVKYSPSTYAANMKTPELIIHGGMDFRISEVQAFGVFNNLQRLGVDSKLVRFPEENHWVVNPSNSLFWHAEVFDWLKTYLGQ